MKYLDEYRDAALARRLLQQIRQTATRRWVLMDVCGGQTHNLLKYGIESELEGTLELIHGPGCPVCVTPIAAIDLARRLSLQPGTVVCSFGDMLRVPGGLGSLLDARAAGGQVQIVYSPLDAVALAQRDRDRQVVFLAVGFETTAPATALAVLQAERLKLTNFSLIVAHVRVLPAMEALLQAPGNRVQGFLAAGHVCAITGADPYREFVRRHQVPVVVTGFEPVDLLTGLGECVRLLERGGPMAVLNPYERVASAAGNRAAQRVIEQVYEVADRPWRGLGVIPAGGLRLRPRWSHFDAVSKFADVEFPVAADSPDCRSAEVLAGRIRPTACPSFGTRCLPETPLGAPMVSSEGACAAYFHYLGRGPGCAASVLQ